MGLYGTSVGLYRHLFLQGTLFGVGFCTFVLPKQVSGARR